MYINPNFHHIVESYDNILISDTDSMVMKIGDLPSSTDEAIKKAKEFADKVNNKLRDILNIMILPKLGVNTKYNKLKLDTEFVADACVTLGIKKNYAIRLIAKKGKVLKTPKIDYTGIPTKKVDAPIITKMLLDDIYTKVLLNRNLKGNRIKKLVELLDEYKEKVKKYCDEINAEMIGKPVKFGFNYKKPPSHVLAMIEWNKITGRDDFKPGTSGWLIHIIAPKHITSSDVLAIPMINNYKQYIPKDIKVDFEATWQKKVLVEHVKKAIRVLTG